MIIYPLIFGLISCSSTYPVPKTDGEEKRPRFAVHEATAERSIHETSGKKWVASTQGRATTDAIERMYAAGGNIIDAAVSASFTISVERPHSTGLGGGGFMLYRVAKTGKIYAIDFRERAPSQAKQKMYLDAKGAVFPNRSLIGIRAGGVPGLVKGLSEIHRRFGKLPFAITVQPGIELARSGVPVYPSLETALFSEKEVLSRFPDSKKIFLKVDGTPYVVGETIIQAELARSLKRIADSHGADFYSGKMSREIVKGTRGWISESDLRNYRVKWRSPVRGKFKQFEVVSMPPPSSGGVHVLQILKYLENEPLAQMGFQSAPALHRIASAMQAAFLDRARYMGDPDFVRVPVKTLLSDEHIEEMKNAFETNGVNGADSLDRKLRVLPEHSETTHFSIMDQVGNVVVSTQTINGWFGSGMVLPGTGILLNNEMDDFSAKPGATNLFGAVGSHANAVAAGKTPLSSMSPTIILEKGKPRLALGAPGGTRIISCVAQTILNHLVYGLSLYDSVNALRVHQQWKPDVLSIELPGLAAPTEKLLSDLGWKIKKEKIGCAVMAVEQKDGTLWGVSEPRDHGKVLAE